MTGDLPPSRRASPRQAGTGHRRRGERVVLNRQGSVAVRPRLLHTFLARACELVLPRAAGVAVCLVSDAEIARLNRTYRGKGGATDVLSFPAAARNGGAGGHTTALRLASRKAGGTFHLGDIAISPAAARRNARTLGRSVPEELRVLILHGVLHLAGYDHETDEGEMERRELRLRRRLGIG
jgi:probable rRNA maturation factor